MHGQRLLTMVITLGAAVLSSCDRSSGPVALDVPSVSPGPYLRTAGGFTLSQAKLQQVYDSLTRDVALALRDPAVRAMVYAQLHASPYREHKVHFRTFMKNQGRALLNGVASVKHVIPDAALAMLDSLVDFEFYMPQKSQWKAWTGGPDLVVANELEEDGALPVGFDLSGAPVQFTSHNSGPTTPTLAIVPVETDFTKPAVSSPQPQRSAADAGPGLYLTSDYISDLHESWLKGDPEVEVHAFVRNTVGEYVDLQCAGNSQPNPFKFNQDDHTYSGPEVEIIPQAGIGANPVEVSIWEDDVTPCTGSGGRPPFVWETTQNEFDAWGARPTVTVNGSPIVSMATLAVPMVLHPDSNPLNPQHDDEIGEARVPSCWPSSGSGPATFGLNYSASGHASNGSVNLDFRFGTRNPLCTPPPLSVTLGGPSMWPAYQVVTVTASASYGTPPYHYTWLVNGAPYSGCGDKYWCDKTMGAPGTGTYFQVTVNDAQGGHASDSHIVIAQ